MQLRKLNEQGIRQLWEYLAAVRETPTTPLPLELADDPRFTDVIEPKVEIQQKTFATKYDAGEYLRQALSPIPVSRLRIDAGIWAWLAYWYFDELCPADGNGHRKPKENSKYIPQVGDHRRGLDKHLLFFPWKMCRLHGESVRCFFGDPLGVDTRAQREWTSYRLNVTPAIVQLAARLYAAENGESLRRNATGKQPGNFRRFVQVMRQLEVTFDIHGMNAGELELLLPAKEFSRWKR